MNNDINETLAILAGVLFIVRDFFSYNVMVICMKYEVNEKKFYKIDMISKIIEYKCELKHLDTTFDFEKYELCIILMYIDANLEEKQLNISIPIELTTSMTEQLTATIKNVDVKLVKDDIEIDMTLDIEVVEIEPSKEEIHDNYQAELEVKLQEREEALIEEIIIEDEKVEDAVMTISSDTSDEKNNFFINLKTEYIKYKILNLDDLSLDKISAKYNLSLEYLYNLKKQNNKVIVHDKE